MPRPAGVSHKSTYRFKLTDKDGVVTYARTQKQLASEIGISGSAVCQRFKKGPFKQDGVLIEKLEEPLLVSEVDGFQEYTS
jgi:predicted MarR family transcription regulator